MNQSHCKLCNKAFLLEKETICFSCLRCEEKRVSFQNKRKHSKQTLLLSDWLSCLEKHSYACKACKKQFVLLTLDHIVSLSKGGLNSKENIQPLCSFCHEIKASVETKLSGNKKKREEAKELKEKFIYIFASLV